MCVRVLYVCRSAEVCKSDVEIVRLVGDTQGVNFLTTTRLHPQSDTLYSRRHSGNRHLRVTTSCVPTREWQRDSRQSRTSCQWTLCASSCERVAQVRRTRRRCGTGSGGCGSWTSSTSSRTSRCSSARTPQSWMTRCRSSRDAASSTRSSRSTWRRGVLLLEIERQLEVLRRR